MVERTNRGWQPPFSSALLIDFIGSTVTAVPSLTCSPLKMMLARVARLCHIVAMKEAVVRARVDSRLKAEAEAVLDSLGINTTEAIRMFLSQVRLRRGLPFAVEIPANGDLLLPTGMRQEALDSLYDD